MLNPDKTNMDVRVVESFGDEWSRFDQSQLCDKDFTEIFANYFAIFPWEALPENAVGFDLGCGSGRWATAVASKIGELHCIDPSSAALEIAKANLSTYGNCLFHWASVDNIPLADNSADFGYSLGVLHHIPDTTKGIKSCVRKLKSGAPFLLYLYYAFDNRPMWFRLLWKMSNCGRILLSRTPYRVKSFFCDLIATFIYWPLARTSWILEKIGSDIEFFPLSYYRNRSFYVMRTDALDRFGTRLEKRFTKQQIHEMMQVAGLEDIRFSKGPPYWVAVGVKSTKGKEQRTGN